MRLIGYITIVFLALGTQAQSSFSVKSESGEALIGATAQVKSLDGELKEQLISDRNGVFNTTLDFPFGALIRNQGFIPIQVVIDQFNQEVKLTPSVEALQDVIVTGQFEPQAIDQSVHTVKAIDRERIEAQGAVDLADVLSNDLNITLTPNKGEGRTSISMLGLDGQYVKVLIDGIPFPSIDGNGNNVDITQINLNTIERIEIVEGPMAVSYGANAFAGVINLITKTNVSNTVSIQEESVGPEYGLDRGRHIHSINLGRQLSDRWMIQVDYQRNDFKGFQSGFEGEDHAINDDRRGYDWHPKLQHSANASVNYMKDFLNVRYRFSYFNQTLDLFSRVVFPDEHPSSGVENPYALDDRNVTNRFTHNLMLSGQFGEIQEGVGFNVVSAYAQVETDQITLRKRILTDTEEENVNEERSLLGSFTSRGNFTNFLKAKNADIELGYEYTYETVDGADIDEGTRSLNNIAAFASLEWSLTDRLTLRPGLRTFYNSQFSSPLVYSLNAKYNAPGNFDIRASFGRSYRTPNITELYFFFVDANHDVTGNPNLKPEDGYGISLDIKKTMTLGSVLGSSSIKAFFNDLKDQITLGVVNEAPLQFRYINVDRFKSKGLSFSNRFEFKKLVVGAGASYIGRFNQFVEEEAGLDEFLFSPEANLNVTYSFVKPGVQLAVFFKHTGSVEQYVFDSESESYLKGETAAFNWLDFTTTWKFAKGFTLQSGVKNLLDLRDVQSTSGQSGAHTEAPTNVGLTYGRSYFLRASYSF